MKEHIMRKNRSDKGPDSATHDMVPTHQEILDHENRTAEFSKEPQEIDDDIEFNDTEYHGGTAESLKPNHDRL